MMTNMIAVKGGNAPTMSSRVIAELADARHNDVVATIGRLFDKGLLRSSRKTRQEATGGRPTGVYDLIERDVYLVISGYSDEIRARIVDRWQVLEEQAAKPVELSRMAILKLALESEEHRLQLESKVVALAPKAEALDRIALADGSFCIRDAAKTLQVQEKILKQALLERRWLYRRPMGSGYLAYSDKLQQGLLEHKITSGERGDGSEWIDTQARITAKGLAKLAIDLSGRLISYPRGAHG